MYDGLRVREKTDTSLIAESCEGSLPTLRPKVQVPSQAKYSPVSKLQKPKVKSKCDNLLPKKVLFSTHGQIF
jgi:hypothetical protein